eukprot:evm.model.scf_324.5 EVM.evm.TU.scf_324.5   scf_324:92741-96944(-)
MSRGDSRARQPGCFRQLCCMSRATAREMEAPTPKLSLPSSRSGAEGSSGRPPRQPSSRQAQYSRPVGPAGPWAPCMAAAACGIMPLQTMSMYSGAVHETGGLKLWSPKSAPEPMCPGAYGPPGFVFDQSMAPMGAMGAVSSARRAEKRGREYSPHAGPMPSMGRLASPVSPECAPARPESSLSARSGIEGVVSARARGEKAGGSKAGKALPQLAIAAPGVASLSPRFSEVAGEGFQYTPSAFTPTSAYSYGINSSEQFSAVGGFDPASIQWGGFLGRGNFSTVYKGRIDGIDYGVKIIRNPVSKGTERLAGFMANNVLHPNLKAYGNSTQAATLVAIVDGRRPKMPAFFPSWYSQLVEDCWHQNRQARPNFADIVERINLMVLAFERPRTPDHFMPESYSSNHSEMIVAYPGAQPFMEGDLHTNPFYEHDQSEGIFEPTAYCVPESNFHSISFDDMACGPGSALPLAPPVMMAASPPSRRKQPRAKRSTLSDNSLPDLRESEPDADSQDGTAATKSQQDTPSEAPETIEPTPGASESEEEADVVTRFRKFSASLGRSSPIPEERVSLLGGTSKKGSTFMRASGESMRVLGRPSMVSTEASITPRSSCATPTDSEYWGSDWSPPRTAGQRGESSKSNKAGKPSASAKAAGDKGGASSSGRRGVMDSMSRDVHYVNQWDPMMSSGLLREAELGATFLRPVKVQGGEPSQPLWDSFMTPAAREFGSPCVMYGGGAV